MAGKGDAMTDDKLERDAASAATDAGSDGPATSCSSPRAR